MQRAIRWLAALALLAAACTSPEERLAHHVARGEAFLRDNEIDAALLEFQSALGVQPENAALYQRIGDVLMEYSQLSSAVGLYSASMQRAAVGRTPGDVSPTERPARTLPDVFAEPQDQVG